MKNTEIICVCTKDKAVCEALLVKAGILVDGNDQRLRDLSFSKWYKVDRIMASLFGFNTPWLLNKEQMKKGLKEELYKVDDLELFYELII